MSSQRFIFIPCGRFLQQYMVHHFGDPIVLPKDSAEVRTLKALLVKGSEELPSEECSHLRIEIPWSKEKDPRVYARLLPASKKIILDRLELIFLNNLWTELLQIGISTKIPLDHTIAAFCENHGIEVVDDDKSFEAIRQRFYRMRRKYMKENNIKLS